MGQACSANHQREGDAKHIGQALGAVRVGFEAQLVVQLVESIQQPGRTAGNLPAHFSVESAAKTDLRNRIAGQLNRDENRWHQEGEDQDAVLGYLRPGDAFHAPEHRVDEYDGHANQNSFFYADFEEAAEDNPYSAHLTGHIGEADEDRAEDRDSSANF